MMPGGAELHFMVMTERLYSVCVIVEVLDHSGTTALKQITHFGTKSKTKSKALSQSLCLFFVSKYTWPSTAFNLFSPLYPCLM